MKVLLKIMTILLTISILTGCLYPEQHMSKNRVPYINQLNQVQIAVEDFQKDTDGLLPIKTRDMKTPIYQKYPIDFNRLIPRYMSDPPGSAYENGGEYLYVLVDVEKNPTVKLIDLNTVDQIRDLKQKINIYRQVKKYPPFKAVVAKGVFSLDFKELGYHESPYVKSPFTGKNLPLVIDGNGEIYVDYRIDLYEVLKNKQYKVKQGDDIRHILADSSAFVPAYSLPYTVDKKNEPTFLVK
jgi:hypothetical protein